MKLAVALAAAALWVIAAAAEPQVAPATAASPPIASPANAPTADTGASRSPATPGGMPIIVTLPDKLSVKLDGLPQPSTGPGWFGSAVLAALFTGIASLIGIVVAADKRQQLESDLLQARNAHELALQAAKDDAAERLAAKDRLLQAALKVTEQDLQQSQQFATLGREDQRIELEKERLRRTTDASEIEIEVSAVKLAREHSSMFANLMHTFFDRLSSPNAAHRELAILALSEFVEEEQLRTFLAKLFDSPEAGARYIDFGVGAALKIHFEGDFQPSESELWPTAEQARLLLERGINADLKSDAVIVSLELQEARPGSLEIVISACGYAIGGVSATGLALAHYEDARTGLVELIKDLRRHYERYRMVFPLRFLSSRLELTDLRIKEGWEIDQQLRGDESAAREGGASP